MGLRHAVDPDHIAAIDGVTRKLMHQGKKPLFVGLFFSLGHSTVVILLSFLVIISASFIQGLPALKSLGLLLGTAISAFFLLLIALLNIVILFDLARGNENFEPKGIFTSILKPVLKSVNKSGGMYPVGFLFGLGFDTATEVALLSLSASAIITIPRFAIFLLPLTFTIGMTLVDTLDGILMQKAFGWASLKPQRRLLYNFSLTLLSALFALAIGLIELRTLLRVF